MPFFAIMFFVFLFIRLVFIFTIFVNLSIKYIFLSIFLPNRILVLSIYYPY